MVKASIGFNRKKEETEPVKRKAKTSLIGKVLLSFKTDKETRHRLRNLSSAEDRDMADLLNEAIREYLFKKYSG